MTNGYPTTTVVPFGQQNVDAADITVSDDASAATKFTFPSPVFLQNGIEYAFCVITNNVDYTMYTSRLGQTTLDGSRLISNQPYLGSMFKSQNASTWTAEQNEDVKFKINRCKFTENTEGTVHLVNDIVPELGKLEVSSSVIVVSLVSNASFSMPEIVVIGFCDNTLVGRTSLTS